MVLGGVYDPAAGEMEQAAILDRRRGPPALMDRPRPGRPPKVTCALEQHLNRLVDQDPLQHGSIHSPWSCRELAAVLAHQTGVQLGRESVRGVLKKRK